MSQIIEGTIKRKGSDLFLINDSELVKLVPICRISSIEEEIKRIQDRCDRSNKESVGMAFDHVSKIYSLLSDRRAVIFGGIVYTFNSFLQLKAIDGKIDAIIEERILRESMERDDLCKNLLHVMFLKLNESSMKKNSKSYIDYLNAKMSFEVIDTNIGNQVFCVKQVDSFRIRCDGIRAVGVWEFPACTVGVMIEYDTSINPPILGYDDHPMIIYPASYIHPFVYGASGEICLGTFTLASEFNQVKNQPIITSLYNYLTRTEYILKDGYSESATPANGHLSESRYNKYKIYNSIEDEARDLLVQYKKIIDNQVNEIKNKGI